MIDPVFTTERIVQQPDAPEKAELNLSIIPNAVLSGVQIARQHVLLFVVFVVIFLLLAQTRYIDQMIISFMLVLEQKLTTSRQVVRCRLCGRVLALDLCGRHLSVGSNHHPVFGAKRNARYAYHQATVEEDYHK
jgi:hypothetical protein